MIAIHEQNQAILTALRQVMLLPVQIVSLKVSIGVDQMPIVECTHHPEIDVTHIDSKAREFKLGLPSVTKRYALREISA